MNEKREPGFAILDKVLVEEIWPHLRPHWARLIPLLLARGDEAFEKQSDVAKKLGLHRNAVGIALNQIVSIQMFTVQPRYRPNKGGRTTNVYARTAWGYAAARAQIIDNCKNMKFDKQGHALVAAPPLPSKQMPDEAGSATPPVTSESKCPVERAAPQSCDSGDRAAPQICDKIDRAAPQICDTKCPAQRAARCPVPPGSRIDTREQTGAALRCALSAPALRLGAYAGAAPGLPPAKAVVQVPIPTASSPLLMTATLPPASQPHAGGGDEGEEMQDVQDDGALDLSEYEEVPDDEHVPLGSASGTWPHLPDPDAKLKRSLLE